MRHGNPAAKRSSGFAYVMVLVVLALMGTTMAVVGTMWQAERHRLQEDELLRIGAAYAEGIRSYQSISQGHLRQFPPSLDALLLDQRFAGTVRHIRRLYPNPLNPLLPWGVIRGDDGTVRGVYCPSDEVPLKRIGVDLGNVQLMPATHYRDWKFIPTPTP